MCTNGDGACSLHAAFGHPSGNQELFTPGARELASSLMRELPSAARTDPTLSQHYESVCGSFWQEFVMPHLAGTGRAEAALFWGALEARHPTLAVEARRCADSASNRVAAVARLKEETLELSRVLFTTAHEARVVRREHACDAGAQPRGTRAILRASMSFQVDSCTFAGNLDWGKMRVRGE